jgi:hypothetical protein
MYHSSASCFSIVGSTSLRDSEVMVPTIWRQPLSRIAASHSVW